MNRLVLLAVLLVWPAWADEKPRKVRLGGIFVSAGYSHFSGRPYYYGPWGPYFYPPYFSHPYFYHPYYGTGFARGLHQGEVKLRTARKDAEVFIDGAYAGTARDLGTLWLDPGAYNLEVRDPGRTPYTRRIYVLSGKTLRIDATREPEARP